MATPIVTAAYDGFTVTGDESVTPPVVPSVEAPVTPKAEVKAEPVVEADEADDETGTPQEKAVRTRTRLQKRIDELTEKRYKAEGERDALQARMQAELDGLKAQLEAGKSGKPEPVKETGPAKPTLEQFQTEADPYAAYVEALAEWKADQKIAADRTQREKAERDASARATQTAFEARLATFKAAHPDFDAKIETITYPDGPGVPAMRDVVLHEAQGPALLYLFGQQPKELARIAALPPGPALFALGRLASQLDAPLQSETGAASVVPVTPKAPAPIAPVTGAATVSSDPLELGFGPDYVARMNERDRQRRAVR